MTKYKIRTRDVVSRIHGERSTGPEVQVVEGRRVVARFDFEEEAERWIERQKTIDSAT